MTIEFRMLQEIQGRLPELSGMIALLVKEVEEMNPFLEEAEFLFMTGPFSPGLLAPAFAKRLHIFEPVGDVDLPAKHSQEWHELRILVQCFAAAMWETGDL